MNLREFIESSKRDPNLFWRLQDGEIMNLLQEAIERIEELESQLRTSCRNCGAAGPFHDGLCAGCRPAPIPAQGKNKYAAIGKEFLPEKGK